jgi:lysyl-tRNA synthetase class 2
MKNDSPTSRVPDTVRADMAPLKSAEAAIIEARRADAKRIREEKHENPFANDLGPKTPGAKTLDIADVRAAAEAAKLPPAPVKEGAAPAAPKYDEAKVKESTKGQVFHLRGRLMRNAASGGLTFLRVKDRTGDIQLLANEASMGASYTQLLELSVGDIVEAEGTLTASKRGDLSLEPSRVRLLTKSFRPLPEKWHGLADVETRYRQRYVDLIANPEVAEVFRARTFIIRAIRKTLDDHGFMEVETPTMSTLLGGAVARPFTTHHNALDLDLFMRIAPELYLKRLVVGGFERVYELARCYRNEGISTRHNPEFTMLEFYQAYATYDVLMDFTEVLLRKVDAELAAFLPDAHAKWKKERPFTIDKPFFRVSMSDAVKDGAKKAGITAWTDAAAKASAEGKDAGMGIVALLQPDFGDSIKDWAKSSPRAKSIDWGNFRKGFLKCENDGERLFCAYEYVCEPFLPEDYKDDAGKSVPIFIKDYPFETSPLARRNDARPELVDRFELFVHGRELCNAFSELNDPDDQAARFRDQVEKKEKGAEETMDYDEDYIRALEYGMPPAAGFGMGIDRLTMMLTNQNAIRDVILFPLLRPE